MFRQRRQSEMERHWLQYSEQSRQKRYDGHLSRSVTSARIRMVYEFSDGWNSNDIEHICDSNRNGNHFFNRCDSPDCRMVCGFGWVKSGDNHSVLYYRFGNDYRKYAGNCDFQWISH